MGSIPSPLALASPFGRRGDAARTAWYSRSWGATAVDGLRGIKEAVRPCASPLGEATAVKWRVETLIAPSVSPSHIARG